MAHFDYTRAAGFWNPIVPVTSAEMADLDSKTKRAVNGDEGGVWAPSSAIEIGGAGLVLAGPVSLSDTITITATGKIDLTNGAELELDGLASAILTGTVTFDGSTPPVFQNGASFTTGGTISLSSAVTLGVSAPTTFFATAAPLLSNATLTVNGGSSIAGQAGAQITGEFTVPATLSLTGAVGFASGSACNFNAGATLDVNCPITLDGTVTVTGAASFSSTASFSDPVTVSDLMTFSGAGHPRLRHVAGVNANASYGIADADIIFVSSLTASRTYTILHANAAPGDLMRIMTLDSDDSLNVDDETAGNIVILRVGAAWARVTLLFDGAIWRPLHLS